ncbi:MAG: hypothetical protein GY854_28655 [Deltaproteobacteria bacterium]|nr:hypothetical protein [Deltaproteobacteria bacterium]
MLLNNHETDTTVCYGRHEMPGVWRYFLPEDWEWLKPPREILATCDQCYQVATSVFHDDCRCCTYFPQLPNFMLGLALRDPASGAAVKALIEQGHALPTGLVASPAQYRDAVKAYADDKFGRESSLVCPLVEPKSFRCKIYPYRNSVCSTFFCTGGHGSIGEAYWPKVGTLIGRIETVLAQWAMEQAGIDAKEYFGRLDRLADRVSRLSHPESGAWQQDARELLFGEWFGRETQFFDACAEQVLDKRSELYEIACSRKLIEPLAYENAVRAWIPEDYRDHAPQVSDPDGVAKSIQELWYLLKVSNRKLWALPFNEAFWILNDQVAIEPNAQTCPLSKAHSTKPYVVRGQSKDDGPSTILRFLTSEEVELLYLFQDKQEIGEQLMESPEAEAIENIREFLAECYHQQILIEFTEESSNS